jgi:uncharacterized membrane protein YgcG
MLIAGLLVLLVSHQSVHGQARSLVWNRWDVAITNVDTTQNQFDVLEIYDVRFNGAFRFGSVVIPDDRLESISNFRVTVQGVSLTASCSELPGTFCTSRGADGYTVIYYFPTLVVDQTISIEIAYTVRGALRIYEGGDQLWWDAIPEEHFGFPILSSTVTVQLPSGFAPREGVDPVVTYGAVGDVRVNGTTITATATNGVGGNEGFSIRVQYPHDADAMPPSWQAAFDERRAFEENVQPLYNIGLPALSLLIVIGGSIAVWSRYLSRGRDPQVAVVPEYLAEPPSALSPGLVGTLLDERADVRDVIAVIMDLARRGYIVIEETRETGFLGIVNTRFVFKKTGRGMEDLQDFERLIHQRLFDGRDERTMESLRNRFYAHLPVIQNALYDAVVAEGLFDRSPADVRNLWGMGGAVLCILGFGGLFLGFGLLDTISPFIVCVPISLGMLGLLTLAFGSFMPAKTEKGAMEAAKWRAFAVYMRNLERYSAIEESAALLSEYIPYAIAFNMSSAWLARFRQAATLDVPPWYYPTYLGGPFRRGYIPGSPVPRMGDSGQRLPGELVHADDGRGFSPDELSRSLAAGMNSMASSIESMLNSAARAMTSQPQSSGSSGRWSSGGGSFSGGGSRGGGGSGGGSRGFG